MRIFLFLLFIIMLHVSVLGQEKDTLVSRTQFVQSFDHLMALELSSNTSFESFKVATPDITFDIHPNAKTKVGFRMNYRFLSLSVTVAPNFIPGNDDERIKGDTRTFEIGTSLIFDHWLSALYFERIRGYYLKNSTEIGNWEEGDPYIQFPDLQYSGVRFSFGYSTNARFSFASLYNQTERQLISAGSFIPNLEFRYYVTDTTTEAVNTQRAANTEITLGPGYAYTYVFYSSYFISLSGKVGVGYQHIKLQSRVLPTDVVTSQDNFLFRWEGALGLGYNGKRFYTGIYGVLNGSEYQQENTTARNTQTRVFYRAFIGYRFNAPRFLKQSVDFIEKLLPLKD